MLVTVPWMHNAVIFHIPSNSGSSLSASVLFSAEGKRLFREGRGRVIMNMISRKHNFGILTSVLLIIASVFASYFVYVISGNSIEEFFPFVLAIYIYLYRDFLLKSNTNIREIVAYTILSLYISATTVYGMYYWNHVDFRNKALLVFCGIFSFFPVAAIVNSFINWCSKKLISASSRFPHVRIKTESVFLIAFFTIFIYWMPVFISEYPGILISDSTWQFAQAAGKAELSNHHPVAHTFIIYLAQRLSLLINGGEPDVTQEIAVYSVIQMLIMASIFSGVIAYIHSRRIHPVYQAVLLIYFAVFPMNSLFSIYMTKDVIFSGMVLLLTIMLVEIARTNGEWLKPRRNLFLYFAALALVTIMRSNGIVASAGTCLVAIFLVRQHRKAFMIFIVIVIMYIGYGSMMTRMGVKQPNIAESLGQPINQIANIVSNDRKLNDHEISLIQKVMPVTDIKASYNQYYSDHIKFNRKFNSGEIVKNKGKYLKLWLALCAKYPQDCLNAMFHLNIGLWYPAVQKGSVSLNLQQQKPFLEQMGSSKSVNKFFDRYIGDAARGNVIESWLWSIGLAVMSMLFLIAYLICNKFYRWLIAVCPVFFCWLSLIMFSPSYCETRYAYYLFIAMPLLLTVPSLIKMEQAQQMKTKG